MIIINFMNLTIKHAHIANEEHIEWNSYGLWIPQCQKRSGKGAVWKLINTQEIISHF